MAVTTRTQRRKPGRRVTEPSLTHVNFLCPEALWEWAVEQPRGAGPLLRRLLTEEQARQQSAPPAQTQTQP